MTQSPDQQSSPEAVWRVCRVIKGECKNCPASEMFHGDECVRGCYAQAVECINTVETGNPWRKTEGVKAPWVTVQALPEKESLALPLLKEIDDLRRRYLKSDRTQSDAYYAFIKGRDALWTSIDDLLISEFIEEIPPHQCSDCGGTDCQICEQEYQEGLKE